MTKKTTRGTYFFSDGFNACYYGLTKSELRRLIRQHGEVVSFFPMP